MLPAIVWNAKSKGWPGSLSCQTLSNGVIGVGAQKRGEDTEY
jgi:hypothetical protein